MSASWMSHWRTECLSVVPGEGVEGQDVLVGAMQAKQRKQALLWFTQSQLVFMKDTKQRSGFSPQLILLCNSRQDIALLSFVEKPREYLHVPEVTIVSKHCGTVIEFVAGDTPIYFVRLCGTSTGRTLCSEH